MTGLLTGQRALRVRQEGSEYVAGGYLITKDAEGTDYACEDMMVSVRETWRTFCNSRSFHPEETLSYLISGAGHVETNLRT